ncbi:MAG TPA: 6-phosphofructokinase, partial [Longimicrobiales bacterium]|nr:6-phosphofructokinase [Longimicrobiales bacterium]
YTALLPTMAGAADRCVIPESPFDMEQLAELMVYDRNRNPSRYSVVLVSEGARIGGEMQFEDEEADQYGHKKLGGIGNVIAAKLKELSPRYNNGRRIDVVNQRLGYMVRCGAPDALDSIVPMAFGNLALQLVLSGVSGRLVSVHNGIYDSMPIDVIMGRKKVVDVNRHYNPERLRPRYETFAGQPLFLMMSDI